MAHKRNLAAPFQAKSDAHKHSANGQQKIVVHDGFVNFRNHNFPPLERIHDLKFNTYCGPTPESNWVIPGVLLVGAYPASEDDEDTFELITSILKHGITKFVCLQSEYQAGVPRLVWRAGGALRPYFEDVQEIVAQKDVIAEFEGHNVVHIDQLLFEHCPIIDCGVTDDSKVVALAQSLVRDISEGQVIYLHCWGGHGRTGTVVCIMLHLLYGMSAKQAFEYCQAVHDLRTCPVEVGSPQTQSQRQQVVRVIAALMHEHEVRKAAQEEESVKRFHAELQQQVLDRERAAAPSSKQIAAPQGPASTTVLSQQVSPVNNTHSPYKGANGAHSGPPLSPPVAIMKPNVVVRDTTQEHIFSMSKQNSLGLSQGNSLQLGTSNGSSKINNPVNNNNHFGRKKHNSGAQAASAASAPASALTPIQGSAQGKMTSFPAILGKQTSSSVPSTPVSSSALQEYSADTSEMSSGGSGGSYQSRHSGDSTPQKATPPGTSSAGTPGGDSSAVALLQTLQAHPPRSPPPHLSPRVENLQKLHSRGTSSPSNSEDQIVGEVYIPPSSDEGDNDHTEDDEEGFIAHAVSTMSSVGGKIPLYQHFSSTLKSNTQEAASSPMQIQISDNEIEDGFDMDTELSATSVRDHDNMVGYISGTSTDSRPMSIVQDSPTVSGMLAAEGLSTMTSTVTTDSLGVTGVNTPSSRAQGTTPPGAYINCDRDHDAQSSSSSSYTTANPSAGASGGASSGQASHMDDQQDSALDDVSELRGAEATTTTAAPSSRSASSDGASSSPKTRRLSGSKVLSNAFKAGIKMFTGGSSSSATTTPTATAAASAAKTDVKQSRSTSSDSATLKNYPDIHLNNLKTGSTDSVASYTTVIATSTSNASTPTSSRTVYDESGARQEPSMPQRAAVEPTPPKGQAPAQRGPLKGGRS